MDRGDISISNLSLPLKSFQISELNMSVVCLIKSGHIVQHTEIMTIDKKVIRSGNLNFHKVITLKGLYSDFTVAVEIYGYSQKNSDLLSTDQKQKMVSSKKVCTSYYIDFLLH